MIEKFLKRSIDILISLTLLILLFPLLLGLAIAIRLSLGTPIFFRQVRLGKHGAPFQMLKFRTLSMARDAQGQLLADEYRLTSFGQFLRSRSLDELPELLNVLKGDMSLVGPRPLLPEYLTRYSSQQFERHRMRPGITGYAQVNGRNATTWAQRFEQDLFYVRHWHLSLDFRILVQTLQKVWQRADISQNGHATMPAFLGNPSPQFQHSDSRLVQKGKLFDWQSETVLTTNGHKMEYDYIRYPDVVVILGITDNQEALLIRQYRPAIHKSLIELPAGKIDPGETPLAAAQREFEEETGHVADTWTPLFGFYSAPGFCTEYLHFFLAENLKVTQVNFDEDEDLETIKLPLSTLKLALDQGDIQDAKTRIGLSWAIQSGQVKC